MKKIYLFLAAVSALMLTACSSDNDIALGNTDLKTEAAPEGVGFDVYVGDANQQTRSGRSNVMNTTTMQKTGFGVFGYQTDNVGYTYSIANPNFMWNQQVNYNTTAAGWYYAPLKYWPNETTNDSQTTPAVMPNVPGANTDKITLLAYAPWVDVYGSTGGAKDLTANSPKNYETPNTVGITYITNNEGKLAKKPKDGSGDLFDINDAKIWYQVAENPNQSVDLLWGVAPVGGLHYTDVAGNGVNIAEGMPLVNLTKPAVNTNMKFMFQHALARLGVKIVAAVDQVAAGGSFDVGNSKITVESIRIKGNFATKGILNLNNTDPNTSLWLEKTNANTDETALVIAKDKGLAAHLIFDEDKKTSNKQQEVTGVTTELADAIQVANVNHADYSKLVTTPAYNPTTPYFANVAACGDQTYATYSWEKADGTTYFHRYEANTGVVSYTDITNTINTTYPNATVWENIYSLTTTYIHPVTAAEATAGTYAGYKAYRKKWNTYSITGDAPIAGDYVFVNSGTEQTPAAVTKPATTSNYYQAVPNYFMVIPANSGTSETISVKITYYVSTQDGSLKDGIVYTKNEVEKQITLPHLKNGVAYNLKLILGLTSVKLEAEVADWVTTNAEVNLPQNTSE